MDEAPNYFTIFCHILPTNYFYIAVSCNVLVPITSINYQIYNCFTIVNKVDRPTWWHWKLVKYKPSVRILQQVSSKQLGISQRSLAAAARCQAVKFTIGIQMWINPWPNFGLGTTTQQISWKIWNLVKSDFMSIWNTVRCRIRHYHSHISCPHKDRWNWPTEI